MSIADSHTSNSPDKSRPQTSCCSHSSATIITAQAVILRGHTKHAPVREAQQFQRLALSRCFGLVVRTTLKVSNCHHSTARTPANFKWKQWWHSWTSTYHPRSTRPFPASLHCPILDSSVKKCVSRRCSRVPLFLFLLTTS